jgi:hypothetical protein
MAEQRLGQAHDLVVIDAARGRQDHLLGPVMLGHEAGRDRRG